MSSEIIGVDGPCASGKSVCKTVADFLGFQLLTTGPIYRTITLLTKQAGIDPLDSEAVADLASKSIGLLKFDGCTLLLDGKPLGGEIRTREINNSVYNVAKNPKVRQCVLPLQRTFNGGTRIVAEGRDICSVVFPDARLKIFLTADLSTRAERRLKDYHKDGFTYMTFEQVKKEIADRDFEDINRETSPLVCTPRSFVIDSTYLSKEEVINYMIHLWKSSRQ